MIALVEGAERQKTPNEIALNILIAGLTLIFLLAVATLPPFASYSVSSSRHGQRAEHRGAGFAAGVPDSDHHRRTAFGDRHRGHGPRDAAQRAGDERQGGGGRGDVNTLLLDKTGTITLGNRQAVEFLPREGRGREASWRTRRSFRAWPTRRRKGAPWWCWPKRSTACAGARSRSRSRIYSVFGVHAHERRGHRRAAVAQGRDRSDRAIRGGAGRPRAGAAHRDRRHAFRAGRHAAGRGRRRAGCWA